MAINMAYIYMYLYIYVCCLGFMHLAVVVGAIDLKFSQINSYDDLFTSFTKCHYSRTTESTLAMDFDNVSKVLRFITWLVEFGARLFIEFLLGILVGV